MKILSPKELLRKYNDLSSPVKATIWFTVCNFSQKGISFFTVPILTRLMPATEYGEYSLFNSWYMIISIFATMNMWSYTLNNGMLKYKNDRSGYLSSLQGLSSLTTIGLFVLYLLFSDLWENMTGLSFTAMVIMFIELLFMPSNAYWCGRARFEYRYKGVLALTFAVTLSVPLVSIPLVMVSQDKGMAAIVGRAITSAVIYVIPAVLVLKDGKKLYDKKYWIYALRFVLPVIPHFLALIVLQQSDRIMIAGMVGEDKAGIYSVAYSAAAILQMLNDALISSFIPYTYNAIKNGNTSKVRHISNYLLGMIAILNLALICLAPEAIKLLGPKEYHEAIYVIPPVAMSGLFMFLYSLFSIVEYYYEQTQFVAIASIGSAVANIVLNAVCIPRFGYLAAGYTTLVCYILTSVGHYVFMRLVSRKYMNGNRIYNEKIIVFIAVLAVALSFMMLALYGHPIIRYAIVLIIGAIGFVKQKWIKRQINEIRKKKT